LPSPAFESTAVIAGSASDEAIQKRHCGVNCFASLAMTESRHCEERKRRSNPEPQRRLDCFASLAMTVYRLSTKSAGQVTIPGKTVISIVKLTMMRKNGSTFQAT
jgi:hypothetical protein